MIEHGPAGLLLLLTIKDHKSKASGVAVSLDYKDYCKSSHSEKKRSKGTESEVRHHVSVNEREGRVRDEFGGVRCCLNDIDTISLKKEGCLGMHNISVPYWLLGNVILFF